MGESTEIRSSIHRCIFHIKPFLLPPKYDSPPSPVQSGNHIMFVFASYYLKITVEYLY